MRREIEEIPAAVDRLLVDGASTISKSAGEIKALDPRFMISVARGSSDHAATFLKYASELLLGLPMASVGPSIASVYGAKLKVDGAVCISVSQSGKSTDIVEMTRSATVAGAYSVAITNTTDSPLASVSSSTLNMHAGSELSVAATKTFVNSLVSGLWLLAEVKGDQELLNAIKALPAALELATRNDWSAAANAIKGKSMFALGRGPSWAISNEAALKFKETCQLHAESYSSAEVMHGPVSIVDEGFPVLGFAAADASELALAEIADLIAAKGANVFVTTDKVKTANTLPHTRTGHWLTDPIASIVSFYAMVEQVAVSRGINPDAPRHLKKVTETV
jgi:glucosamine--fructose-6-phosphate aminotransferase (isomerizing)